MPNSDNTGTTAPTVDLTPINNNIAKLQEADQKINSAIEDLQHDISVAESDIQGIGADIKTINSEITRISNGLGVTNTNVAKLDGTVDTLVEIIADLPEDITEVIQNEERANRSCFQSYITVLTNSLQEDFNELNTKLGTEFNSNRTTLYKEITNLRNTISAEELNNRNNLSYNITNLNSTLTYQFTQLNNNLDTNFKNLISNINQNNNDLITSLNNDFSNLQKSLHSDLTLLTNVLINKYDKLTEMLSNKLTVIDNTLNRRVPNKKELMYIVASELFKYSTFDHTSPNDIAKKALHRSLLLWNELVRAQVCDGKEIEIKEEVKVATLMVMHGVIPVSDNYNITIKRKKSVTLKTIITPDNASNKKLQWISMDESIVTVEDGVIKAKNIDGVTAIMVSTTDGTSLTKTISITVE